MRHKVIGTFVLGLTIVATLVAASGCGAEKDDGIDQPQDLEPVELRQYQGQDLSSIDDFRENSIEGPQEIDVRDYRLDVTGLVANPESYTYDEITGNHDHYQKVVMLNCVEGWSVTILWEGTLVSDLLQASDPLPGAKVVIFHAYDGYTTSLPIDYIMDNEILIAHKMNDVTLPPERGFPFQLVAESKWGYKWIKWIAMIELSDATDYEGFWESRGYSSSGDLDSGFLDN